MKLRRYALFIALGLLLTSAVAFAGYLVLTITGEVKVKEPIEIVGSPVFSVELFPEGTVTKAFTLKNISPASVKVDLGLTITPPTGDLLVTMPTSITIPPNSLGTFNVGITVKKSSPAGTWQVMIGVER